MTVEYDKLLLCALFLLNEKTGRRSITEMEFKNFCNILKFKEKIKVKFITEDGGELLMTYFDMVSLLEIGPSAYRLKLPISFREVKEKLLEIFDQDIVKRIERAISDKWYILTLENKISKFIKLDLKYKSNIREKDSFKLIRVK